MTVKVKGEVKVEDKVEIGKEKAWDKEVAAVGEVEISNEKEKNRNLRLRTVQCQPMQLNAKIYLLMMALIGSLMKDWPAKASERCSLTKS